MAACERYLFSCSHIIQRSSDGTHALLFSSLYQLNKLVLFVSSRIEIFGFVFCGGEKKEVI